MQRNMATLNWHCAKCGTTWCSNYLEGWNDGYNYQAQNNQAHLRQPEHDSRKEIK